MITAALVAFVLIKQTGVDRRIVEKWLYVELGLFLFTGIAEPHTLRGQAQVTSSPGSGTTVFLRWF